MAAKVKKSKPKVKLPVSVDSATVNAYADGVTVEFPDLPEPPEGAEPKVDRLAHLAPEVRNLRAQVAHVYNLQKIRIGTTLQALDGNNTSYLHPEQKEFFLQQAAIFTTLEKDAAKSVERTLVRDFPIYRQWLSNQGGCGPLMAGIILGWFDVNKADTVSKMWAYAGLDVRNGKAPRRTRGEVAKFNPWVRAKLVEVLAGSIIKADAMRVAANEKRAATGKPLLETSPWAECYRNYKHRKESQVVPVCMGCNGAKMYKDKTPCTNCNGTGGPAPWGMSAKHRNSAAKRYMIKMFLAAFHVVWRTSKGLPVRPPYSEEKLGMAPHSTSSPRPIP